MIREALCEWREREREAQDGGKATYTRRRRGLLVRRRKKKVDDHLLGCADLVLHNGNFLMNIDTPLPRIYTFDGSFSGRIIQCWPYTFRTVSNKTQIGCRATPNQAQIDGIVQTDTSSGARHVFCFSEEFRQRSLVVSRPNGEDLSGSIPLSTERRRIGSSGKGEEAKGLFTPLRSLFLPQGWPESVSSDYLSYQLWTFPSHVTGWISTCTLNAWKCSLA